VPAIALPAIGFSELGAVATDLVTVLAVLATPAAGDVINNDPIPWLARAASRADFHNFSRRFVTRDDAIVALGTFAEVLPVNGADVAAANR
jgi:hypothetical protein